MWRAALLRTSRLASAACAQAAGLKWRVLRRWQKRGVGGLAWPCGAVIVVVCRRLDVSRFSGTGDWIGSCSGVEYACTGCGVALDWSIVWSTSAMDVLVDSQWSM